jgi:ATP-dependent RNA helicase DeaD
MNVRALHGDMSQGSRDGVMLSFKSGRVPVLIATDVAARGLDVSTVTHVINFDVPNSPDVYVHRIGRTGRIGRSGRSVTFYEPKQSSDLAAIEKHTSSKMKQWEAGAKTEPQKTTAPPKRHEKPRVKTDDGSPPKADGPLRKLIADKGSSDGIEVADLVSVLTSAGLEGAQIHNVKVLRRFSLLEVPESEADRVCREASGTPMGPGELRLEAAGG